MEDGSGIFWFSFTFSNKQLQRPLGYCPPPLNHLECVPESWWWSAGPRSRGSRPRRWHSCWTSRASGGASRPPETKFLTWLSASTKKTFSAFATQYKFVLKKAKWFPFSSKKLSLFFQQQYHLFWCWSLWIFQSRNPGLYLTHLGSVCRLH